MIIVSPTGGKKIHTENVMLRLLKATRKALEALAAKDSRTLAEYCRLILEEHVRGHRGK